MRYRQMDAQDDYVFNGHSAFLVNSPATVAQAILTRLRQFAGEWFLDNRVGLNLGLILGYNTTGLRDREVQRCILQTQGVVRIKTYSSTVDEKRDFNVEAVVDTIYGQTTITTKL